MKTYLSLPLATSVIALVLALNVRAEVTPVHVTISDAAGLKAFAGTTAAGGTFATGNLRPGNYVVQFNSPNRRALPDDYALVISSGARKVIAVDVPGSKFGAGGVAMRIRVAHARRITGQVVDSRSVLTRPDANVREIAGVRYHWVPGPTGSNLAGQWMEESQAVAYNLQFKRNEWLGKMQDTSGEGSLATVMQAKVRMGVK